MVLADNLSKLINNEEWRMKNEEWRMKNEEWRMKNEEWIPNSKDWLKLILCSTVVVDVVLILFTSLVSNITEIGMISSISSNSTFYQG